MPKSNSSSQNSQVESHVHKLKRGVYKNTGTKYFFCIGSSCNFKINKENSLGKLNECWRCGKAFRLNEYALRLAKPHCPECHNKDVLKPTRLVDSQTHQIVNQDQISESDLTDQISESNLSDQDLKFDINSFIDQKFTTLENPNPQSNQTQQSSQVSQVSFSKSSLSIARKTTDDLRDRLSNPKTKTQTSEPESESEFDPNEDEI